MNTQLATLSSDQITQIAVILAGIVIPIVFAISQKWHQLSGKPYQAIVVLVSYGIAGGLLILVRGQSLTLATLFADGAEITAIGAVVYRQVLYPVAPVVPPEPPTPSAHG